jgi:adenylate cyclase
MTDPSDLLQRREFRGVRLALIARLFVLAVALPVELTVGSAGAATQRPLVLVVFVVGFLVYGAMLYALLRTHRIQQAGLVTAVLDVGLMALMIFAWWRYHGGPDMPPAYMLKAGLAGVMAIFIALNAIALRPLYPLVVAAGMVAIELALLGLALADPRARWTGSVFDAASGPPVAVPLVAGELTVLVLVGGLVTFATWSARRLMLDGVRFEKANAQLGRYFSPAVRDAISGAGDAFLKPGGRNQQVAVMFCDIRNFTGLAETMSPHEVMDFLSDYQRRMVDAVFAHGGTLDKFIGDAIMATFGTPETAPDDARRAVDAAIAMRGALARLNRERAAAGKPELGHGIAIHYGPAVVGNVGTEDRLEYTVIGDTVNVAALIGDLCKPTGEDLLISDAVRACLGDGVATREIRVEGLRGRRSPVAVYAVDAGAGDVAAGNVRPDFGREG